MSSTGSTTRTSSSSASARTRRSTGNNSPGSSTTVQQKGISAKKGKNATASNGPASGVKLTPTSVGKAADLELALSTAKKTFNADIIKDSPTKRLNRRETTPTSDKGDALSALLLSPASLKKAGIGSPPKKKPKLWKSKWQMATLTGGVVRETGKRKRASEASRLLDDEGVIHMLNRVPSVYGLVPDTTGNDGAVSRIQRARSAAVKTKQQLNPKARKPQKPVADKSKGKSNGEDAAEDKRRKSSVSSASGKTGNDTGGSPVKTVVIENSSWEPMIQDILKEEPGIVSPRRGSRNPNNIYADRRSSMAATLVSGDDECFNQLRELPADQLELLMNCDIRYSLPKQGPPANNNNNNNNVSNKLLGPQSGLLANPPSNAVGKPTGNSITVSNNALLSTNAVGRSTVHHHTSPISMAAGGQWHQPSGGLLTALPPLSMASSAAMANQQPVNSAATPLSPTSTTPIFLEGPDGSLVPALMFGPTGPLPPLATGPPGSQTLLMPPGNTMAYGSSGAPHSQYYSANGPLLGNNSYLVPPAGQPYPVPLAAPHSTLPTPPHSVGGAQMPPPSVDGQSSKGQGGLSSPLVSRLQKGSEVRTWAELVDGEERLKPLRSQLHERAESGKANAVNSAANNPGSFSEIFLRLYESFAQITIAPGKTKLAGSLSPTVIEEIIRALTFVSGDKRYKAVLLTGVGSVFCQGVDLFYLINDKEEKRKEQAEEMAAAVERLVLCLASFPKLLVAAVNGLTTGLGLSILPLCDLVYANDKATFNSLSSRLGHIPEGGSSVTLSQSNGGNPSPHVSELFLLGRHLTATEMHNLGLVNDTFIPGRLMEEAIPRLRKGCASHNYGMQCNKMLLKQNLRLLLERVIPGETKLLTDMWQTKEFYTNLVHFITSDKNLVLQQPKH